VARTKEEQRRTGAQAAIDRFTSNAYDLVIEGESYRARLKPGQKGEKKGKQETSRRCEARGGILLQRRGPIPLQVDRRDENAARVMLN
jgi:hypothetical protein